MTEILRLLIFSAAAVVYLFLISKILGKKQIAQLEFIDYVIGISIGSIASEMATDINETPFYHYLIAMTVFFLFDALVTFLGRKGIKLKRFFKGKPIAVMYDGKIDFCALKKSKLDVNELISLCREKGFFDLNQVAFAVFENSGKLSVMPKGQFKPVVISDVSSKFDCAILPYVLVVDGNISYSTLKELNKNVDWMLKKLNFFDKKQLKNIIFAEYNKNLDEIIVHYKN